MPIRIVETPESSNIRKVAYNRAKQEMRVEFANGGLYSYAGVPAEVWIDLIFADSVGSFFAREIKPVYQTTKVSTPCGVPFEEVPA